MAPKFILAKKRNRENIPLSCEQCEKLIIIFGQAPEQELPGMDFDVANQQKVNFTGKVMIIEVREAIL